MAALVLCPLSSEFGPPVQGAQQSSATEPLSDLEKAWSKGEVETIQILHVRNGDTFPIAVTPERLERWCNFRLIITGPKDQKLTQELMERVTQVHGSPTNEAEETRWGIVFGNARGERLLSLYLGIEKTAVIGDKRVLLATNSLLPWVEKTLGGLLR